jgi:DNA-binding response OmpR family regulator
MLCVDDNQQLLDNLASQFRGEDFDVDTAPDGLTALELVKNKRYDIILLDLRMPKMDGMTVLKEIKKIDKDAQVIMLTGVNEVQPALECVKLGARDYISKPYDPEELLQIVTRVLEA